MKTILSFSGVVGAEWPKLDQSVIRQHCWSNDRLDLLCLGPSINAPKAKPSKPYRNVAVSM